MKAVVVRLAEALPLASSAHLLHFGQSLAKCLRTSFVSINNMAWPLGIVQLRCSGLLPLNIKK